jgi:membrane protease YdiL (CAAX protease family)
MTPSLSVSTKPPSPPLLEPPNAEKQKENIEKFRNIQLLFGVGALVFTSFLSSYGYPIKNQQIATKVVSASLVALPMHFFFFHLSKKSPLPLASFFQGASVGSGAVLTQLFFSILTNPLEDHFLGENRERFDPGYANFITFFFQQCLFNSFKEELLWRKITPLSLAHQFSSVPKEKRAWLVRLYSSILFGFIHLENTKRAMHSLPQALLAGFRSYFIEYPLCETSGILASFGSHFASNFALGILLKYKNFSNWS